ncbi:hypothetical protein NLI96_g11514 [Meripilus lineatus]|uniref:Uncharacterized protein n=1 Tax=Meripilus lineatus TaxID=2056292 RepID=A0AAD5URM5_9APHY|nr:hypothetical protein NLI96_g11514 [Physisporinus lineatus]
MSATAPIDPTYEPTQVQSTDIPLQPVPPASSQNPEAGSSSAQNDQVMSSAINEIPGPQNLSRRSSIDRNRQDTLKGKTMTELKKEFVEKCAEIDKEHPEFVRKEGDYWNALHAT